MNTPQVLQITSPDGHVNHAVFMLPDGDGPFAGVVAINGGTSGQSVDGLVAQADARVFAFLVQHLRR